MTQKEFNIKAVNSFWRDKFKKVPYQKRLLLISHCLRHIGFCQEKRIKGMGLLCLSCDQNCQVNQIVTEVRRLKYKNIYIISGGKVVESIIAREKPVAIVAVACFDELLMGVKLVKEIEKGKSIQLPLQLIELGQADCESGSQVNMKEVKKILHLK